MTRILLLSDTHGYIGEDILKYVEKADEVWHAGDFGSVEIADRIATRKPLRGVYGNIDGTKIRNSYGIDAHFSIGNLQVWMTHIGGYPNNYDRRIRDEIKKNPPDLFISGHSHILKVMYDKELKLLHMNPGAAGKYGFHQKRTMLRFEIDNGKIENLEVIELGNR